MNYREAHWRALWLQQALQLPLDRCRQRPALPACMLLYQTWHSLAPSSHSYGCCAAVSRGNMAAGGSTLLARLQQLPQPVSPASAQGVEQITDDLHEVRWLMLCSQAIATLCAAWQLARGVDRAARCLPLSTVRRRLLRHPAEPCPAMHPALARPSWLAAAPPCRRCTSQARF